MSPIRVLLVDDHRIVRQGLRSILDPDPEFEVVGETGDGAGALQLVAELQPDIILLDLKLPNMDGVVLCQRIMELYPQTAVLALTAFIDQSLVNACLQAGARGYLLKDAENLHLKEQLMAVMQGYVALDPRAAGMLTDLVRRQPTGGDILSLRDLEVLRLIAQGLTNREISTRLHLSENTVKGYVKEVMAKMGVHNRVEAVLLAKERGIL
jgi:two-component system, NarL family, response regulator DevR